MNHPETDRLMFGGFSFPVLPTLNYQLDGPDKQNPDRLFIEDRERRFLLYLERDGLEQAPSAAQKADYDTVTIFYHNRRLKLVFPLQKQCPGVSVGYFHVLLPGDSTHPCTGSLCIAPPERYAAGLGKFTELHQLFAGLRSRNDRETGIE